MVFFHASSLLYFPLLLILHIYKAVQAVLDPVQAALDAIQLLMAADRRGHAAVWAQGLSCRTPMSPSIDLVNLPTHGVRP
jgi:hypothetical protein